MHFEFEFCDSGDGQFVKYWGGDGQVQLPMTVDDGQFANLIVLFVADSTYYMFVLTKIGNCFTL